MNILNTKQSDITQKDIVETKAILERHCALLLHNNPKIDKSIINTIALSRKYNIPLLTWIIDVYHRFLVNYWIDTNGKILLPIEFIDNYLLMQNVQNKAQSVIYNSFKTIISTFHRTMCSFPEIGSSIFKYDDNLNEYIQITTQINNAIIQTALSTSKQQQYPTQLDVWIIPYNVIKDEDDGDYLYENDTDQDTEDDDGDDDIISDNCQKRKNLRNKLFSKIFNKNNKSAENGYKYKLDIVHKLKVNKKMGIIKDFDTLSVDRDAIKYGKVVENYIKNKLSAMKQHKRYILLIDRRKENENINIYFYEAPENAGTISKRHHQYLKCTQFFNSQKCVLPKDPKMHIIDKSKDIGLFDTENGYMFGLSYHLNNDNSIASYWSSHGTLFRFLATDMRDIWPYYFVYDNKYNNKLQSVDIKQFNELEDISFQTFYEITSGRNDLYSRNTNPFGIGACIKHQSTKPITSDIQKHDESGSGDEEKYELGSIIDNKCAHLNMIINQSERETIIDKISSLDDQWSNIVSLSIQNIKDRFDDDECDVADIIDDIDQGVEESELLFDLIENGILEKEAVAFGQQLIYILNNQ